MIILGMLGYDGGKAKKILKNFIHFDINDMQVSEDMQMICFNYIMKKFLN